MKRTLVLGVLVLVASSAMTAGAATARGHTYVTHDCLSVRMRPRSIIFTCADGGFYAKRLEWRRWYRYRAVGHGVFHANDCTPSCAGGTFHKARGRIVLRGRMRCPDIHRFVFARATITYHGKLLGRHRVRRPMMCPI